MSSWSTRFRPPIDLPDGRTITTLDDARAFILTLTEEAQQSKKWQHAIEHLLLAADPPCSGPWIDFARIGMMRALLRNVPQQFNHTPRDKKWGRRPLKRDQR
jgi:hypothetical protein